MHRVLLLKKSIPKSQNRDAVRDVVHKAIFDVEPRLRMLYGSQVEETASYVVTNAAFHNHPYSLDPKHLTIRCFRGAGSYLGGIHAFSLSSSKTATFKSLAEEKKSHGKSKWHKRSATWDPTSVEEI